MAHPLISVLQEAYAAFARGDLDGYLKMCTDDFTFQIPGQGGISGKYIGRQGMADLAGKVMQLTAGTFQEEVKDVLANDNHAIVLAEHRFTRSGNSKCYETAHVYDVVQGKVVRCFEQPRDPAAFEEAWGSSHVQSA